MAECRFGRHDWLGLTPEIERFGPGLVESITRALGRPGSAPEKARVERLICNGDAVAWMAYLAVLTALVDCGVEARVAEGDVVILAGLLRDQYHLAAGVLWLSAQDEARRDHLEGLLRRA